MSEAPATTPAPRVTLRTLRQWAQAGRKFPMLTCYDATLARWVGRGGVHTLLVGDTAAQVVLGHDTTLPATMDLLLALTAAVRRGAPEAFVMADMPFGSYQCGEDEALRHALSFLSLAGADAVKLEVHADHAPLVRRMSRAGVPVVPHIGARPQTVRQRGGFGSAGRTRAEAGEVVRTARVMLEQDPAMLLVEAVPAEVGQAVVAAAQPQDVPVIGCGAGPDCHGHVVVLHDLLGLSDWQPPFAPRLASLGPAVADAARAWEQLIASGDYLRQNHPYPMPK
jgi:3-methyl-2-oxobutanoate hydroxymethyltransferase